MFEFACIYLNKQSSKYARILNVSNAVHIIRSLNKILSSYWKRDVFRTLSNRLRWSVLQKEQCLSTGCLSTGTQPEIFLGGGGPIDKNFIKIIRKKGPASKYFGVFSPRYSLKYILNGKFNPKIHTIRTFFLKSRHFIQFSEKGTGGPTCDCCWICISIVEYP